MENNNNNKAPMKEGNIIHRRGYDMLIEFRTVLMRSTGGLRKPVGQKLS
jgi:hypothetical protein